MTPSNQPWIWFTNAYSLAYAAQASLSMLGTPDWCKAAYARSTPHSRRLECCKHWQGEQPCQHPNFKTRRDSCNWRRAWPQLRIFWQRLTLGPPVPVKSRCKLQGKSFSRSKQLALVSALLQKIRAAVQGLPLFNTTNAPKMACKRFSRSPYGVPSYSCSYSSMKCCASLRASNPSCSTM